MQNTVPRLSPLREKSFLKISKKLKRHLQISIASIDQLFIHFYPIAIMQTLNIESFNPKKAELQVLAEQISPSLSITIIDKKTYDEVHKSQMLLQEARLGIEKTGKSMREEALAFQKAVIAAEKDLIDVIEPIERELKAKKKAYNDELERVKQERVNNRIRSLAEYGYAHDFLDLGIMDDTTFSKLLDEKRIAHIESEALRIKKIEDERIAREKFEEDQRKLQEERDALDAEKKIIQEEKDRLENARKQEELETQRKKDISEAEERARLKAIEDMNIEKERKALKEKEEQESLEKKKKYQTFLATHGITDENKNDFYLMKTDTKIIAYKKL